MEILNRKARHDYHIIQSFTAGLSLKGTEVKSIKNGGLTFSDPYCFITSKGLIMKGISISNIQKNSFVKHDEKRDINLLLNKSEISKLIKGMDKGKTIVPLKLFVNSRGLIKAEIALVKGKNNPDKRESIKKRDIERDLQRNER
jgi:SsrA-binding protein